MFSAKTKRAGFTLTELMISAVILSLLTIAVMPVIRLSQQGFSSMEARNSLKSEGQGAINKIGHRLAECKRFFENTAGDNAFLAMASLSAAPMAGSVLPRLEELGSISPSSSTFVASSVGNRLFFASVVPAADVVAVDSLSVARTVRIDLYIFNAYYLSPDSTKSLFGKTRQTLREWHSDRYADYNQIMAITDTTKRANTAIALAAQNITFAWNPSASVASTAFYQINPLSGAMTVQPAHAIAQSSAADMIRFNTGLTSGGFRYGICPNTSGLETLHTVPQFGTASGLFPAGFEVIAVGPNSGRQVFLRLVLGAEGTFPGLITSEQVLLTTVRDLW